MPRTLPLNWWGRYIGIPFGETDGALTCWGLVRRVYSDILSVELPAYGEISARDLVRVARAFSAGQDDGWSSVATPESLDVALMRSGRGGRLVVHVGVMADARRVLHVEEGAATAIVPITHFSVAGRIIGFRRLS